ncbi:hypothetical protein LAZ67_23000454 [Cordylochernes scorpioides]|uniref:RNase H type-1 domain-containing protein n=1 Tax=Cordylochernes scorpioides TaxID=51811 RepID=A0ABY6LPZ5_9ARAC|nr:hypothetical protein LAZ67_23000454 [Cordylochernes scorpioides]
MLCHSSNTPYNWPEETQDPTTSLKQTQNSALDWPLKCHLDAGLKAACNSKKEDTILVWPFAWVFSFAKLPFRQFSNFPVRGYLSLKNTLALQLGALYREKPLHKGKFSFAKLPFLQYSNSPVRGYLSLKDILALQLVEIRYHVGIPGNELADSLVKAGAHGLLEAKESTTRLDERDLLRTIKTQCLQEWKSNAAHD